MLKMIIFDMDGVLVDACGWHKDALNEALEEVADFRLTEEEHEKHFNGLPTMVKLENFDISPEEAFIVEDSPKGIKAAEASGCKVMKVKNATHVHTESKKEFINENFNSNGG